MATKKRKTGVIRSGFFHFRMNRPQCIRIAQMLYENGMTVERIELEMGGRVKGIRSGDDLFPPNSLVKGELEWENWGRMIRID